MEGTPDDAPMGRDIPTSTPPNTEATWGHGRPSNRTWPATGRSQTGHTRLTWVSLVAPHVRPYRIKRGEGQLGRRALMAVQLGSPSRSLPPPHGSWVRASGRGSGRARGARRGIPRPPGCFCDSRGAGVGLGCRATRLDGKVTSPHFIYPRAHISDRKSQHIIRNNVLASNKTNLTPYLQGI